MAELCFQDFHRDMEELYGSKSVVVNIHHLRHLVHHVKNFRVLVLSLAMEISSVSFTVHGI